MSHGSPSYASDWALIDNNDDGSDEGDSDDNTADDSNGDDSDDGNSGHNGNDDGDDGDNDNEGNDDGNEDDHKNDDNGNGEPTIPLAEDDVEGRGMVSEASAMDCALFGDDVVVMLIENMNGGGRAHQRERRSKMNHVVSEIYSPPRVTKLLSSLPNSELIPGFALDLATTDEDGRKWDFGEEEMRQRAWERVAMENPCSS